MVYDNMRVAISKFAGCTEKVPSAGLLELSRWYWYQWRFCNATKGNEKGHVERSVEFVRRKTFAFKDDFDNLQQAQHYLQSRLVKLNERTGGGQLHSPAAGLGLERKGLYSYPGCMESFSGENFKVDKYATICLRQTAIRYPTILPEKWFLPRSIPNGSKSITMTRWFVDMKGSTAAIAGKLISGITYASCSESQVLLPVL